MYPIRRARRDHLLGIWHEYYWTWATGKVMWCGKLNIKRGIRRPYSVTVLDHRPIGDEAKPSRLRYRGDLEVEGSNVVVRVRATTHSEAVTIRYPRWIPSSEQVVGIWSAYDHTGSPAAGAILLSRQEVDETDAKALLASSVATSPGLLRVRSGNKQRSQAAPSQALAANSPASSLVDPHRVTD